jgi:hypothetical protein
MPMHRRPGRVPCTRPDRRNKFLYVMICIADAGLVPVWERYFIRNNRIFSRLILFLNSTGLGLLTLK